MQHPANRWLQLAVGPDPVDFVLFRLSGGFAAAHGRNVRFSCDTAPDTSMTDGRIHGHDHMEGMAVMRRAPVISQMIGLRHIAHAVDDIGRIRGPFTLQAFDRKLKPGIDIAAVLENHLMRPVVAEIVEILKGAALLLDQIVQPAAAADKAVFFGFGKFGVPFFPIVNSC